MKIKLRKINTNLPNCWKQCGVSLKDWKNFKSGKEIEVNELPDFIKHLVEISTEIKKVKGDK
tara:strand:+ start:82 stop:267 length:186 start_codon:yes stop_codon:yes gene_type:complete